MEAADLDPSIFEGLADLIPPPPSALDAAEPELISAGGVLPADSLQSSVATTALGPVSSPDSQSSHSHSSGGELSPVEELLVLIDWRHSERSGAKRTRGPAEKAHEKHVQNEKKRREDLTLAIEEINSLIPSPATPGAHPEAPAKRTKVNTLQDAAEYLKRLQDVALQLLQENKRLAATLQEQPPLPVAPAARSRPALQGQEVMRLFILSSFLVWMFIGLPNPWADASSASISFSSRAILNVNAEEVTSGCVAVGQFLRDYVYRFATGVAVFMVVWVCTLLTDMPRVSDEEAKRANELLRQATAHMERDSNFALAAAKHTEAMAALHRALPTSKIGTLMFFAVQLVRALLNILLINLWLERLLVYVLGRTEITLIDARAYMLAARLCRSTQNPRGSALLFFGCVLSCASGLNVGNADQAARDEFGTGVVTFLADAPRTKRRTVFMICVTIMTIAEAQLHINAQAEATQGDAGGLTEWSVIRMVAEPLHAGKFQHAFNTIMDMLPTVKGESVGKLLMASGMISFCLRRYHAAFLLMTTAVKAGEGGTMCGKVRYSSACILLVLHKMGMRKQGQLLLPHLENSYLAVPNARTNLLPMERIFFLTCKIAFADDWPSVIAHTRELLSIVDALGIQRNFKLPFTLEIALSRLFEALELANESEAQHKRDTNAAYLLHQRGEIRELAEMIITHLSRSTYWAAFVHPMVERARGWHAYLCGDKDTAAYHLNRSLLDAKRWDMAAEHAETKALMDRAGIAVLVESEAGGGWCRHSKKAEAEKPPVGTDAV